MNSYSIPRNGRKVLDIWSQIHEARKDPKSTLQVLEGIRSSYEARSQSLGAEEKQLLHQLDHIRTQKQDHNALWIALSRICQKIGIIGWEDEWSASREKGDRADMALVEILNNWGEDIVRTYHWNDATLSTLDILEQFSKLGDWALTVELFNYCVLSDLELWETLRHAPFPVTVSKLKELKDLLSGVRVEVIENLINLVSDKIDKYVLKVDDHGLLIPSVDALRITYKEHNELLKDLAMVNKGAIVDKKRPLQTIDLAGHDDSFDLDPVQPLEGDSSANACTRYGPKETSEQRSNSMSSNEPLGEDGSLKPDMYPSWHTPMRHEHNDINSPRSPKAQHVHEIKTEAAMSGVDVQQIHGPESINGIGQLHILRDENFEQSGAIDMDHENARKRNRVLEAAGHLKMIEDDTSIRPASPWFVQSDPRSNGASSEQPNAARNKAFVSKKRKLGSGAIHNTRRRFPIATAQDDQLRRGLSRRRPVAPHRRKFGSPMDVLKIETVATPRTMATPCSSFVPQTPYEECLPTMQKSESPFHSESALLKSISVASQASTMPTFTSHEQFLGDKNTLVAEDDVLQPQTLSLLTVESPDQTSESVGSFPPSTLTDPDPSRDPLHQLLSDDEGGALSSETKSSDIPLLQCSDVPYAPQTKDGNTAYLKDTETTAYKRPNKRMKMTISPEITITTRNTIREESGQISPSQALDEVSGWCTPSEVLG